MKKRKVPHTFVIVFAIIVIAAVLTWIIPPGKYVQEQVGGETVMKFYYANQLPEAVGDNGFHPEPQTWQVFSAFYKGFVKQANIIAVKRENAEDPRVKKLVEDKRPQLRQSIIIYH